MRSFDAWLHRTLGHLPGGAKIAARQNRLASFAEQGLQGVANLAVNIILARALTRDGFATVGTMIGIHFFILGIHRTAIVLPFILDSSDERDDPRAAHGRWWWFNLAALAAITLAIVAASGLSWLALADRPDRGWLLQAILLTSIVTPSLLFFEFGRRCLYQAQLAATAALCSTIYLGVNLSVAILALRWSATPLAGALAWVAAGLVGGALATIAVPPGKVQLRAGFDAWWANRSFAFWQVLTNIPYAFYNSSVVVVIGLINGPIATAAFNAARSLTNPAISMVTAVDSLDKPRAARALANLGFAGLKQSISRTRRLLALLTGCYLGLLALFAGPILRLAFGNAYADETTAIRILSLVFFLMCMNQPTETMLIVLRKSRLLLAIRTIAALLVVASLLVARPWGVVGCCVALLVTNLVNLVIFHGAEKHAGKPRRASETGREFPDAAQASNV